MSDRNYSKVTLHQAAFFDNLPVKGSDAGEAFSLEGIKVTCFTGCSNYMLFADVEGCLHLVGSDFNKTKTPIKIFNGTISHIKYQKKSSHVLVLGSETGSPSNNHLKILKLKKVNEKLKVEARNDVTIQTPKRLSMIVTFAVSLFKYDYAFGMDDGNILFYRGSFLRDSEQYIFPIKNPSFPITGMEIMSIGGQQHLFVGTPENISRYKVEKNSVRNAIVIDRISCHLNSTSLITSRILTECVVATNDGLHFYNEDGVTRILPIRGFKKLCRGFSDTLFVVSQQDNSRDISYLQAISFTPGNSFMSFSKKLTANVVDICYEWGSYYVLLDDNTMFKIVEKDLNTKLKILYSRSCFIEALDLALMSQNEDKIAEARHKYGDYLMEKGEILDAVDCYIKTIGAIEPSGIIYKFMNSRNNAYLTHYLKALHERKMACKEHTTLLINCFISMDDKDQLEMFLQSQQNVNFDIEAAIETCYQAKRFDIVLQLASRFDYHSWYMKILIENKKDVKEAIVHMLGLSDEIIIDTVKKYGSLMLDQHPDLFLQSFKKFIRSRPTLSLRQFHHIFNSHNQHLKNLMEYLITNNLWYEASNYSILFELYLYEVTNCADETERIVLTDRIINALEIYYDHLVVDHILMLFHYHKFDKGIIWLYKRNKQYDNLLDYYYARRDYDSLIEVCHQFSNDEPMLWKKCLSLVTLSEDSDHRLSGYINTILKELGRQHIVNPLELLHTIKRNNESIAFGTIKDYVISYFLEVKRRTDEQNQVISAKNKEIEQMDDALKNIQKTSSYDSSICAVCKRHAEIPCIHFTCKHTFHTECFNSASMNDDSCPICSNRNQKYNASMDIKRKEIERQFFREIKNCSDYSKFIAKYIELGVFNC